MSFSFKAPKGKVFAVLLLGIEDFEGPGLDAEAALNAIGWYKKE